MTLTPPWAGDDSARSRTRWLLDRKPWLEANGVRANGGQIARSGPRKCAERNAHEKGRDALPLTFVSSWSTTLAAGFTEVLPQQRRSHPRPLPQMMPQAPTMFAAAMPQA